MIIEGDDIYGDGVNIAARLEGLAEPGGIVISGTAFDHAKNKVGRAFATSAAQQVKNIPEPVRAYQVLLDPAAAGTVVGEENGTPSRWRWLATAAASGLLIAARARRLAAARGTDADPASATRMALPLPDKPSIAVLPFDNLSDDPEEEYFADGLTDDLITDLSKISGLFVIARNSVFAYKDKAVDVPEVARELGVRYVLEGSVRRAGEQVRINAQLIDGVPAAIYGPSATIASTRYLRPAGPGRAKHRHRACGAADRGGAEPDSANGNRQPAGLRRLPARLGVLSAEYTGRSGARGPSPGGGRRP